MKLKHLALAATLVAASASGFAAGGPLDLTTGSASFGSTPVVGGFVDSYTFTLGSTSVVSSSITSVLNGNQDVDFSSIFLTGPSGVFAFSSVLPDPVEVWALPSATLNAGAYTLTLIGSNSAGAGSYGGNLAVTAAVPEPETYALMLAGLMGVGFMARRRRS